MPEALVVIRPNGDDAALRETLEALRENTPDLNVWFREADAADGAVATLRPSEGGRVAACVPADRGMSSQTFVTNVLASLPDADVVLLDAGVSVSLHWLDRLREAAFADSAIATASAVPSSVLGAGTVARAGSIDVRAAGGVAVSGPVRGCVYVRRDALRIAVAARSISSEGLAQFASMEALLLVPGLVHVLAGTAITGPPDKGDEAVVELATPAIRRALEEIRVLREPLSVAVDLRCCAMPVSGTQVHALQLAAAIAAKGEIRLSAVVPERAHASARRQLDALAAVAELRTDVDGSAGRPLVLHRPYQVFFEGELADVLTFGERLVITHQDMLLDYTPEYFRQRDRWRRYAESTALSLAAADEVVFFSEHARESALRNRLLDRAKTSVVPPGTDHLEHVSVPDSAPPAMAGMNGAGTPSFILVFGHAYPHKNRTFALAVADELRTTHGWTGFIVFAGGRPTTGSSVGAERSYLGLHADLRSRFVDLGPVSEVERTWLYHHASLLLFPSLYEGFGLVPFEAAVAGTPCLYSSRTSVAEYLPPEGAVLDLGDIAGSAANVAVLLRDREGRLEIVEAIRSRASALTWEGAATAYARIYERAVTRPPGFAMLAGDQIVLTHRSELPASETERYALVALRSSRVLRAAARELLTVAAALHRRVRRA